MKANFKIEVKRNKNKHKIRRETRENGPLLSRVVHPPGTKGGPRAGNFPGPPKNPFCPGWSHHPGQKVLLSRVVVSPGTKGGAFCPGCSHHPGQKVLLSRVVASPGTKGPPHIFPSFLPPSPFLPPAVRSPAPPTARAPRAPPPSTSPPRAPPREPTSPSAAAIDVRRPRLRRPRPPLRAHALVGGLHCTPPRRRPVVWVLETCLHDWNTVSPIPWELLIRLVDTSVLLHMPICDVDPHLEFVSFMLLWCHLTVLPTLALRLLYQCRLYFVIGESLGRFWPLIHHYIFLVASYRIFIIKFLWFEYEYSDVTFVH